METPLQRRAFHLLLALVTIAFIWVAIPFYGAVFWAMILAIVFWPLQKALEYRLWPRRNLAAGLSVLVCIFLAVLPVTVIVASLVAEGAKVVDGIRSGQFVMPGTLRDIIELLPDWAQQAIDHAGLTDFDALRERIAAAVTQVSQFLATQALSVGQNTLRLVASTGIMLYVLFFLFRDGREIGRSIRAAAPLSPEVTQALVDKFAAVVRATVKGNLIIAAAQGGIGGVAFWFLGIQGALLWGVLMMFLSLLPAVGAAIVWAPVAAYLMLSGAYLSGAVLIVIGVGVIGLIDNLLRPPLVGKETRLPDYVVLVSTLGGLSVFGLNGFVIGPLIAALFIASWTLFRDSRAGRDESPAPSLHLPPSRSRQEP